MGRIIKFMESFHGELAPLHVSILAFSGLWFPSDKPGEGISRLRWFLSAIAATSSILFVGIELIGEAGYLLKMEVTPEGLAENAAYIIVRIDVLIKLIQSIVHRKEWQGILRDIDDKILKKHCRESERKLIIDRVRKLSESYTLSLLTLMQFTGVSVVLQRESMIWLGTPVDENHKLPVRFWIFTPGYESPMFEVFLFIQIVSQIYTPFCLTALDSYSYVLAAYMSETTRLLNQRLKSLPGRPEDLSIHDWNSPEGRTNFRACIQFHCDVIRFSSRINTAFRLNFFCTLAATMFQATGITLKLAAVPLLSTKFIQGLLVFSAVEWKAWIICSAGDMLSTQTLAVSTAIMEMPLWTAPNEIVRDFSLMTLRAQKPAVYTAWKFFRLSPHVIVDMMKLSYRIFSLLRNMNL